MWRAVRRRPLISERGVRILSMDGGGMKVQCVLHLAQEGPCAGLASPWCL